MSNLFLTLVIAFVIIVLALACLAIGWLITGKTKIERGSCGRDPTQKKDESCNSICSLCSAPLTTSENDNEEEEEEEGESAIESPKQEFIPPTDPANEQTDIPSSDRYDNTQPNETNDKE